MRQISKFQVGLKSLLRKRLSELEFCGYLVYKLKKIAGSNNFSAQLIKIISHYKKIGYNINALQHTACLVVNPITVGNFAFLFNCTPVGRPTGVQLKRKAKLPTVIGLTTKHATHRRAIKEESKVANRDWVDHQACRLLSRLYDGSNVKTYLLMRW